MSSDCAASRRETALARSSGAATWTHHVPVRTTGSLTDGATGQPETSCSVKLTKLADWPDFLKQGSTVYDYVDEIDRAEGKGGSH